jgi:2-C-methyl-D-erythritol 4-phosphate cytidylyltransferase
MLMCKSSLFVNAIIKPIIMKKVVIVVAGGSGKRMKSDIPKQFLCLLGKPILMHTIEKFYSYDPTIEIRLVLPHQLIPVWNELCKKYNFVLQHSIFQGGETRFHSVKNGLSGINKTSLIAVHDAVRPLVSIETINNTFKIAKEKGSAIPVMPLTESIRELIGENSVSRKRDEYCSVQTPQVFQSEILLKSYNTEYDVSFTDDASVVEKAGYQIWLAHGNEENIKITTAIDLIISEALMNQFNI